MQLQRIAAEQRNLEEQQRRDREAQAAAQAAAAAAAAVRRNNERHECNANASQDVKQTLKVNCINFNYSRVKYFLWSLKCVNHFIASFSVYATSQSFLIQKKIEKEKGQNATWNRNL